MNASSATATASPMPNSAASCCPMNENVRNTQIMIVAAAVMPRAVSPARCEPRPSSGARAPTPQHPERGRRGEQVHHRHGRRDEQAAERHHQQQEVQPDDGEDEPRQLRGHHGGEVGECGGDAADAHPQGRAAFGRSASAVRTLPLVSLRVRRPGRLLGELSRRAAAPCRRWAAAAAGHAKLKKHTWVA